VHFTAQAAALNVDCPQAPSIVIPVVIIHIAGPHLAHATAGFGALAERNRVFESFGDFYARAW
jgi:hypothetical protein